MPYREDAGPFLTEIIALVYDASIYIYDLPLLSLLFHTAYTARNILEDSIVIVKRTKKLHTSKIFGLRNS